MAIHKNRKIFQSILHINLSLITDVKTLLGVPFIFPVISSEKPDTLLKRHRKYWQANCHNAEVLFLDPLKLTIIRTFSVGTLLVYSVA
jgi:hypothetical protein